MTKSRFLPKHIKVFLRAGKIALLDTKTLKKAYGGSAVRSIIKAIHDGSNMPALNQKVNQVLLKKLIRHGFITTENGGVVSANANEPTPAGFSPTTLRLLITDACNFDCNYCQIMRNKADTKSYMMSETTAEAAMNLFGKYSPKDCEKTIIFTGGEPLLNLPLIYFVIKKAKTKLGNNIRFIIFTNGALVNPTLAEYFRDNKVSMLVSIDGPKEVHDKARKNKQNSSTFDKSLKGYLALKKAGCDVGISAVVGTHNIGELDGSTIDFLLSLKPASLGLNYPHYLFDEENTSMVPIREYMPKLIGAFRKSREAGVFVEQISRIQRPLISNSPCYKGCSALGKGLTVDSKGLVGPCKTLMTRGLFVKRINEVVDPSTEEVFEEWLVRSTLSIELCNTCYAQSVCGTGCTYDSYVLYGDLKHVDPRACIFTKKLLEFLIWDVYDALSETDDDLIIPTIEQQKLAVYNFSKNSKLVNSVGH